MRSLFTPENFTQLLIEGLSNSVQGRAYTGQIFLKWIILVLFIYVALIDVAYDRNLGKHPSCPNLLLELHVLGSRKLVMHGMRQSGCFFKCREKNQGKCDECGNNVMVYYNDLLSNLTKERERQLPGIKFTQLQTFNWMRNLLEHLQESGLKDGYDSCCVEDEKRDYIEGKTPCRNREDFISLQLGAHPSQAPCSLWAMWRFDGSLCAGL